MSMIRRSAAANFARERPGVLRPSSATMAGRAVLKPTGPVGASDVQPAGAAPARVAMICRAISPLIGRSVGSL
jgi:hypothetical protein